MQPSPKPSTLLQYAGLITRVGLTSFGGGLSGWMLRLVVHERQWMTEAEFLTGLGLCQVFPGINVLNLAIWMGYRLHGNRGALVGALAMIIPPGLVIIGLEVAFTAIAHDTTARAALDGVAAAAIGLGASMGLRAATRALKRRKPGPHPLQRVDLPAALLLLITFATIGLLHLPLIPVIAVLVPISILLAWRDTRPLPTAEPLLDPGAPP